MTVLEFLSMRAITIAGSTFALGLTLGWILAILQSWNSTGSSHRRDQDED